MRSLAGLLLAACAAPPGPDPDGAEDSAVVVTFNTGGGAAGGAEGGPSEAEAEANDALYGNGLAWGPAVEAATAWFSALQPDVVALQEVFWNGDCAGIPVDPALDLACRGWSEGEPVVAQEILGPDVQIACNLGKPDKCVGVRRSFGTWEGCEGDLCLDGLWGGEIEGCGSGARVARGRILRADGSVLTVVHVHGSSGFTSDDAACRVAQVERVFVDLGDGEPGVNGAINLVLGDLNTDPARLGAIDASARRWNDFVGEGRPFAWISDVGTTTEGSYAGAGGLRVDIDHVVSDRLAGSCVVSPPAEVIAADYFDHRPVRCDVSVSPAVTTLP